MTPLPPSERHNLGGSSIEVVKGLLCSLERDPEHAELHGEVQILGVDKHVSGCWSEARCLLDQNPPHLRHFTQLPNATPPSGILIHFIDRDTSTSISSRRFIREIASVSVSS